MSDKSKLEKTIKLAKRFQEMGLKNKKKAYECAKQELKNRKNV